MNFENENIKSFWNEILKFENWNIYLQIEFAWIQIETEEKEESTDLKNGLT